MVKENKKQRKMFLKGFTMIELLVVMAILGVLAVVGVQSFRLSQAKSRDARRKSDLEQVQRALEMYVNDHKSYPTSDNGKILGTNWGGEFADSNGTIYMKELPKDPRGNPEYCYSSDTGNEYKLYAKLENSQDPKVGGPYSCNGVNDYNYGVSSPNTTP